MTGLFNYYSNKKGNCLKYLVLVEESSRYSSTRGDPSTIVDHTVVTVGNKYNWISASSKNSYFTIVLHNFSFRINSYSVRMRNDDNINRPLEWELSGSNNGIDWETIHHRSRSEGIIDVNDTRHYNVNTNKKYACFRFTQIGMNSTPNENNPYSFTMGKVEFFGTLSNFDQPKITCHMHSRSFFSRIFSVNVLLITS